MSEALSYADFTSAVNKFIQEQLTYAGVCFSIPYQPLYMGL